jgi:hypothetical protein
MSTSELKSVLDSGWHFCIRTFRLSTVVDLSHSEYGSDIYSFSFYFYCDAILCLLLKGTYLDFLNFHLTCLFVG